MLQSLRIQNSIKVKAICLDMFRSFKKCNKTTMIYVVKVTEFKNSTKAKRIHHILIFKFKEKLS